jgi:DNA replication protein DnaC
MSYHPRTRFLLSSEFVGVGAREMGSLDLEPIHSLPEIRTGYGLWGDTGTGKTWAFVQVAAALIQRHVMFSAVPSEARLPAEGFLVWVNWPERAESLKRMVIGGGQDLAIWVRRCKSTRYLFLDDLGRERIKDESDYSLGLLTEILDARYRANKPTWWTSNLSPDELASLYKSRLASRILSAWPPYHVEGSDMRLGGTATPRAAAGPARTDGRALAVGRD